MACGSMGCIWTAVGATFSFVGASQMGWTQIQGNCHYVALVTGIVI